MVISQSFVSAVVLVLVCSSIANKNYRGNNCKLSAQIPSFKDNISYSTLGLPLDVFISNDELIKKPIREPAWLGESAVD